jgi:hypothetical protein
VGRVSREEGEVADFLESLGVKVIRQERTILKPAELDLYLPDYKVAIEYSGMYWHSDVHNRTHTALSKYKMCKDKGIRLITLYNLEWKQRRNAVKSLLRSSVGLRDRVYARKTTCSRVPSNDVRAFYEENHISGFRSAEKHYALMCEGELVAAASFSKTTEGYELIRYASQKMVVGGLQKLIRFARLDLKFSLLTSYCDMRLGTGESYAKAGFVYAGMTEPDYVWYKGDSKFSRYQCQKHKLKSHPAFAKHYADELSETQICESAGFIKVKGVGHSRWVLDFSPNLL